MKDSLNELCRIITENCAVKKIILYGLKRHPITEDIKDINLCVVVEGNPKEAEKALYIGLDCDYPVNFLVYEENEFNRLVLDNTSYAHSIANKGAVLYG